MIGELVDGFYSEVPTKTLYHYTSLTGLMGIVQSRRLWISEARYLNDAEELKALGRWVMLEVSKRTALGDEAIEVLRQFKEWLDERLDNGALMFVASFTPNGNLLSQWRGYCPHGQGVSAGFEPGKLKEKAAEHSFLLGRCLYTAAEHKAVVIALIQGIIEVAQRNGPSAKAHPSQNYHPTFQSFEGDVLRSAALLKSSYFSEEEEWRVVSLAQSNYVEPPIAYRPGKTMLIPYLELEMPTAPDGRLDIEHVYMGPTPTQNLSVRSLSRYLSKYAKVPQISNSMIPYRE